MPGLNLRAFVEGGADERKRILDEYATKRRLDIYQGELDVNAARQRLSEEQFRTSTRPYTQALTNQTQEITAGKQLENEETRRLRDENAALRTELDNLYKGENTTAIRQKAELAKAITTGQIAEQKELPIRAPITTKQAGATLKATEAGTKQTEAGTKTENVLRESKRNLLEAQANYENLRGLAIGGKVNELRDSLSRMTYPDGTPRFSPQQVDNLVGQSALASNKITKLAPELIDDITRLQTAKANIQTIGTVEGLVDAVGKDPRATNLISQVFGQQKALVTDEDIEKAMKIIDDTLDIKFAEAKLYDVLLPFKQTASGEIEINEGMGADITGRTQSVLPSPEEEESFRQDMR